MINLISNSINLICQQKVISEPQKGSFHGKKVINIDPSYLQKKNFGAGAQGMLKTLYVVILTIAMVSSIFYVAFSVVYLKIPVLTITATPLGAKIMGFWMGAALSAQAFGKD